MGGSAIVVLVTIALLSMFLGVQLLIAVLRKQPDPPIPVAREANPGFGYDVERKVVRGVKTLGKSVAFVLGSVLVAWPWLLMAFNS